LTQRNAAAQPGRMIAPMSAEHPSYPDLTHAISRRTSVLRDDQPEAMRGFRALSEGAMSAGVISAKAKELMALALGIAAHCDGCIGFHAKALVKMGATRAEIEETIAVAVYMGGGPSLMFGANALAAFEQFSEKAAAHS
jgi:AhpD family alkylhydroperoxidase